ncbi:hypothetical protein Ccrd_012137 [Cynara cardunculus var. scolymus]|uniref:Uncharacterized protein n=1 Tax=Cynara cardunculus var. scolymus TaxID=59895 RepID=A0A103YI17_CYNCS|nr:hypothetical protein Ccrd_012137 [Cynara cardunculus var. scolymus]
MSQGGAGRHRRRPSQSVFDFQDDVLQPPPVADNGGSDKEFGHASSPNKIPEQHCIRPTTDVSGHLKEKGAPPSLPPTSQKKS